MGLLDNKTAIVTGSSRGIGADVAKILASEGAAVVVNYRQKAPRANKVVQGIEAAGGRAVAVGADLTTQEGVQALASAAMVRFLSGGGLDHDLVRRALELERADSASPVMLRPSLVQALLLGWTGRLDEARDGLLALRRRCLERGQESDLMFLAFHAVIVECWRGDLVGAGLLADDTMERALQLGTDVSIGYLSHDADTVQLYLQETLTFLCSTAEASVALSA